MRARSPFAGLLALLGGLAAIIGSFLDWGIVSVFGSDGVERERFIIDAFDSNGLAALICGAILVALAVLFFFGIPSQRVWAAAAFVSAGVLLAFAIFSFLDIRAESTDFKNVWIATGGARDNDEIQSTVDIGTILAIVGGGVGLLSALFFNRGRGADNS